MVLDHFFVAAYGEGKLIPINYVKNNSNGMCECRLTFNSRVFARHLQHNTYSVTRVPRRTNS